MKIRKSHPLSRNTKILACIALMVTIVAVNALLNNQEPSFPNDPLHDNLPTLEDADFEIEREARKAALERELFE